LHWGEVAIYLNGQLLGHVGIDVASARSADNGEDFTPRRDNAWTGPYSLTLPDNLVNDAQSNILTFDNTYNPPKTFFWGIRQVNTREVTSAEIPPLSPMEEGFPGILYIPIVQSQ
jgi:hypothetical protein